MLRLLTAPAAGPVIQLLGPITCLAGKRHLNVLFSSSRQQIVTFIFDGRCVVSPPSQSDHDGGGGSSGGSARERPNQLVPGNIMDETVRKRRAWVAGLKAAGSLVKLQLFVTDVAEHPRDPDHVADLR